MSLRTFATAAACLIPFAIATAACSDDDDPAVTPGGNDAGTGTETGTDPGPGPTPQPEAGTDAGPGATARVRVAHLAPDAPAVRVCVTAKSASFSANDQPATPSLSFKQISVYLTVPAGEYKARIVGGAATDCGESLAGLPDVDLPAVAGGDVVTAAAIGKVANLGQPTGFRVAVLPDLPDQPAQGKVHLRFFHAAPTTNIPVFVGIANGTDLEVAVFNNVAFGTSDTALAATRGFAPVDTAATAGRLGAAASADGAVVWASDAIATTGLPDRAIRSILAIDADGAAAAGDVDVIVVDDTAAGANGINDTAIVLPKLAF